MSSFTPHPNRLRFGLKPKDIEEYTDHLIKNTKENLDKIAAIPQGNRTWGNTMKALEDVFGDFSTQYANIYFPSSVDTNKEVRDASSNGKKKIDAFKIETYMREDLYQALLDYQKKGDKLDTLEQRLLSRTLEDFERNGLGLPPDQREKLKEINKRISEISIKANQNMNEEASKHKFSEEELKGLPEDFLKGLSRDNDGKFILTLKYPDYVPVQKHCEIVETRKKLETAYSSRCQEENVPLLEELIKLRHEGAVLLGFPNHASFVLKVRMAKTPQTVIEFLDDLIEKLQKSLNQDINKLLQLKKAECDQKNIPFDNQINSYDYNYYMNMLLEKEYKINENEIKQYFPVDVVTKGLLDVYQELLGLKFIKVENPNVWHPDVEMFEVFDSNSGEFVGQFYIDMYPRDGKYTHAAAFGLQKAFVLPDGTWQHPAAAIVCNFTKPTPEQPSFLKHDEVETFFHEMGHIFHNICSKSKYSRFSGTSVERDFVEAPSQMLENWCWEKSILSRVSQHQDTKQPLPDDLLDKMIKSKLANVGLLNCRQLFFGKYDMFIHTRPDPGDLGELFGRMREEITKVRNTPGTNWAAAWGHIFGGYDASYYGYMWSEVYSCDMFELFKKSDIMSKELGARYRKIILEKGGTKDGMDLLKEFLGREPDKLPFLEQKGLL